VAREVGVKLKISHRSFLRRLKELGMEYKILRTLSIVDEYYDNVSMDLSKSDKAFRIRKIDGRILLTFKGRRVKATPKLRVEMEANISDSTRMARILEAIGLGNVKPPEDIESIRRLLASRGYMPIIKVEKQRTEVKVKSLSRLTIYLDNVRGLGEYVEVEGPEAVQLIEDMGLSNHIEHRTYPEILMETVKT